VQSNRIGCDQRYNSGANPRTAHGLSLPRKLTVVHPILLWV
jgi:hypothetical protein